MEKKKDLTVIPEGPYCYTYKDGKQVTCPYWSKRIDKPNQENGHCSLLGWGDWQASGLTLLWDQVKECGINDAIDEGWSGGRGEGSGDRELGEGHRVA